MTGELAGQNTNINTGYGAWSNIGEEVPFAGDGKGETADNDFNEENTREINSLEQLEQQMKDAGYEIKKTGEATVLGRNQNGNIRISSAYRDLWYRMEQEDPEFYHDVQNNEFSTAIWDVCNAAMFEDLNQTDIEDGIPNRIWEKCIKLATVMQNPEYNQRATRILDMMDNIGTTGEMVLATIDVMQNTPAEGKNFTVKADAELQRKQESYARLEQSLNELHAKSSVDSDEWEGLAEAYDALGDYADARARAESLRNTVRQLEEIVGVDS